MKKYSSKPAAPGLRFDGMPNRAWRRSHTAEQTAALTLSVFRSWMAVAASLVPGYVPQNDDEGESNAQQAA